MQNEEKRRIKSCERETTGQRKIFIYKQRQVVGIWATYALDNNVHMLFHDEAHAQTSATGLNTDSTAV